MQFQFNRRCDIRSWIYRVFLRRPFFPAVLAVICAILSGCFPGYPDPEGSKYHEADARRLTVSGIVEDRSLTVYGYRIILDHLTFYPAGENAMQEKITESLNQAVSSKDRLQVFLSDGSGQNARMYGDGKKESGLWPDSGEKEDQSGLFRSVSIGDRIILHGKCTQPEHATNPGQFDSRQYYLARRIVLKMSEVQLEESSGFMEQLEESSGFMEQMDQPDGFGNPFRKLEYGYRNLLADLRIGIQRGLKSVFGPEDAAQVAAFVLGEGSGMDAETKQLFRDGGMSWLVCVSSLPVSLLGMMVYFFLRKRGISFVPSSIAAYIVTGSYVALTGFSLSARRALFTFTFWLGAQIFGRARDTLNTLSAAALIILIRQPAAVRDSSFLLSCACILSLEYLTPAVSRVFRPQMSWQKKLCASFSLYLGSLPAVLWFFYQTTPLTFLLYPVTLALMGLTLGFGILGSIGGYLYLQSGIPAVSYAGRTFAWPCRILLSAFRYVCMAERKIPFSILIPGRPQWWQVLLFYGVLSVFVILTGKMDGRRRPETGLRLARYLPLRRRLAVICLFIGLTVMLCFRWHPEFRYTCLDIGQGSCNLIEHNGSAYLFDAGSSSVENVWRYRIDSTLKYYGISRLDMIFVSHGDMDHINGIGQVLENYEKDLSGRNAQDATIGQILVPDLPSPDERLEGIVQAAEKNGIRVSAVMEGASVSQGEMKIDILDPSPERITGNSNEDCIVMLLTFRDLKILFAGDLEKEGESLLVNHYQKSALFRRDPDNPLQRSDQKDSKVRTDQGGDLFRTGQEGSLFHTDQEQGTMILVAGHHGSRNATSKELLEMVKPDLVLISCGKNNRYGHPAQEMLKRVEEAGAYCRRTDLEGAIQVIYKD